MSQKKPSLRRHSLENPGAVQSDDGDGIEYRQEGIVKSRGHLAGARRVRHSRCSFRGITEVIIANLSVKGAGRAFTVHRLKGHVVRRVCCEVQHEAARPRW